MTSLTLGRKVYKAVLNRVQILITKKNPAVIPKLKETLRRKPRRAALLMESRLLAPGV